MNRSPAYYFDWSGCSPQQVALFSYVFDDLMRSATFADMMQRVYHQHGRVRLSFDPDLSSTANQTMSPVVLNFDLLHLERSAYAEGELPRALTFQRLVVHEIAHLADDKDRLRHLMFRRLATQIQEVMTQGASRAEVIGEIMRDNPHYTSYFGYRTTDDLITSALQVKPITFPDYIAQTEPLAVQADNQVMHELYGEGARDDSATTYMKGFWMREKGWRCEVDRSQISADSVVSERTEPCAYRHIPGKQRSLVPEM